MKVLVADDFYTSLQKFTELTCQLIRNKEFDLVETCFDLAEKLVIEGGPFVKNAILGIYIPSLRHFLDIHSPDTSVVNLLPHTLRTEYHKQDTKKKIKSDVSVFVICLN